ncbi:MAG: DNA polymerase III subunit epsilon [Rhizobiaceae bacterium]
MREIIFDTETTGLDFREDRVIELGCIELVNRFPTGRSLHLYINPQGRAIHPDALAIHGIGVDKLEGKPVFAEIVEEFMLFIEGAKLVAHNAGFDMSFINAEFQRLGHPVVEPGRVVDTLALARRKHPMGPNSLDALCKRYGIDNSHRTKHGALLDSELLAEVYVELAGGRQAALILDAGPSQVIARNGMSATISVLQQRPQPLASRLSDAELVAHAKLVAGLGEKALWSKLDDAEATAT